MKNFNLKLNIEKIKSGFTLIEALVSIALILIAVIGPLSLTFNAINSIRQNKNRIIASYLAEEVIENFRNYRDDFSLSCGNLNLNFDYTTQQLSSVYCISDTNLADTIPPNYYNYSTPPDTNPQNIAWKMFLSSVMGDLATNYIQGLNLDNDTFYFSPQNLFNNKITSYQNCSYLKFDDNKGYNCSTGYSTPFRRTVNITKLSGNILKIDVSVVYLEYGILSQGQKSVSITDYLYER